jgi:hypothetical protein
LACRVDDEGAAPIETHLTFSLHCNTLAS